MNDFCANDTSFELKTCAFTASIVNGTNGGILSDVHDGCAALALVQQACDENTLIREPV